MAHVIDFKEAGFDSVLDELEWRGLISQSTDRDRLAEALNGEPITYYCGFNPTAASLHIGNLVQLINMRHLQAAGHHPIALVGGATGLIGDPRQSGERTLNPKDVVAGWADRLKKQIGGILETEGSNPVRFVSNYDWTASMNVIDFLRDVGKNFRMGTMLAKDTVARRLNSEEGISFTEFSYQLLQGYDYLWLYENKGCRLQLGGSDQWGNITTGTELIRRMLGKTDAFALTCPLIRKADGTKFGKTEKGNIWLDPEKTSPYEFYQFWLNVSDEDAERYIKIFTLLDKETIDAAIEEHRQDPGRRTLQQLLAKELTTMIHGADEYANAVSASKMLFGNSTSDELRKLDEKTFLAVFSGVPTFDIQKSDLPCDIIDLLAVKTQVFSSKGEARKMVQGNGVSINKDKVADIEYEVSEKDIVDGKYILAQKGKKNYFIINVL